MISLINKKLIKREVSLEEQRNWGGNGRSSAQAPSEEWGDFGSIRRKVPSRVQEPQRESRHGLRGLKGKKG